MYVGNIYVSPANYSLVGVGFVFTILGLLFASARIITRLWLVRNIGVDDAFIVVAALGALGFMIGAMEQVRYGLGEPMNPALLAQAIQATFASVIAYTVCHLAIKLSICFQCLRLFPSKTARWLFTGLIVYVCVYGAICLLLTILTCWPVEKYWFATMPGKCLDSAVLRYAFAGINIANDIALLIAPMPFLSSLQIARRAKYILMGVFACGSVACIVAIIRLYSLYQYSSVPIPQRPSKGVDIALWTCLEVNISIMCACVPALKPLFVKAFPGLISSLTRSSKNRSAAQYVSGSRHNYDNITGPRSGTRSHLDPEDRGGIKVQQSFEMRTTAVSDDNDSEKNLVTSNTEVYAAAARQMQSPRRA